MVLVVDLTRAYTMCAGGQIKPEEFEYLARMRKDEESRPSPAIMDEVTVDCRPLADIHRMRTRGEITQEQFEQMTGVNVELNIAKCSPVGLRIIQVPRVPRA